MRGLALLLVASIGGATIVAYFAEYAKMVASFAALPTWTFAVAIVVYAIAARLLWQTASRMLNPS